MFLSFIVPVYNTEKYLTECLDSLLEQDIPKEDYEIICINDGSTDGSLEILRSYKNAQPNIRIVDQKNAGLSAARNAGLSVACGEYVWFVDSDDFIQRNCLASLYRLALQEQCDRISFSAYTFSETLSTDEIQKANSGTLADNTGMYNIVVWKNLFRRAHLNKHRLQFHPELHYAEDGIYMFEFSLVNNLETEYDHVCYFYRLRNLSLTSGKSYAAHKNKIEGDFGALQIYRNYFIKQQGNPKELSDKLMATLWHLLFTISQLPFSECYKQLKLLHENGLYPFAKPNMCSIRKSYMTTRTDIIGKIFDKVYLHMHRPWGFAIMVILQKLIAAKNKLVK